MLRLVLAIFIIINFSNCKSIIQRKDKVTNQLNNLKTGVLLVRLPTNAKKIEQLKKLGKHALAKKEKTLLEQFHKDVFNAFEKRYTYSSVYFYYSPASKAIQNGNYGGNLYDYNGNLIESISFADNGVFYAEYGRAHEHELTQNVNGKDVKIAGIGGRDALVIRTKEGLQPKRPFPYSVIASENSNRLGLELAISRLDKKLFDAHNKMQRRKLRRKRRGK